MTPGVIFTLIVSLFVYLHGSWELFYHLINGQTNYATTICEPGNNGFVAQVVSFDLPTH